MLKISKDTNLQIPTDFAQKHIRNQIFDIHLNKKWLKNGRNPPENVEKPA